MIDVDAMCAARTEKDLLIPDNEPSVPASEVGTFLGSALPNASTRAAQNSSIFIASPWLLGEDRSLPSR